MFNNHRKLLKNYRVMLNFTGVPLNNASCTMCFPFYTVNNAYIPASFPFDKA